ncbi:MAG: hypothetical protein QM731_08550 [Chitinophagaceae bacterium]
MSTTSAYFIPVKKFPVGQFKKKAKRILEKLDMIDGYYDEEDEWYASGKRLEFEYAAIHDTDYLKLVPEASSAGYGSTCINCEADIDEEFYDSINEYYDLESDSGEEKNMNELELICKHCNTKMTLGQTKFKYPVLFANQFFQFVDINDEIEPRLLKKIESKLCCKMQLVYERM